MCDLCVMFSFQEYCSILFLKPRMKIILRDKKVKTKLISKSLSKTEKDCYKPRYLVSINLIKCVCVRVCVCL